MLEAKSVSFESNIIEFSLGVFNLMDTEKKSRPVLHPLGINPLFLISKPINYFSILKTRKISGQQKGEKIRIRC
jgi:hypothetical protein